MMNRGQQLVRKYGIVVLWSVLNAAVFIEKFMKFKYAAEYYYLHRMLGVWLCISRGSAAVINANLALIALPVSRGFITLVTNLAVDLSFQRVRLIFDHLTSIHLMAAKFLVGASIVHSAAHLMNALYFCKFYNFEYPSINACAYPNQDPLEMVLTCWPGVTGVVMALIMIIVVSSSFNSIREYCFEIFFFGHKLIPVFLLLILLHSSVSGVIMWQSNVNEHQPGCIMPSNDSFIATQWNVQTNFTAHRVAPLPSPHSICRSAPHFKRQAPETWLWLLLPLVLTLFDFIYRRVNAKSVELVDVLSYEGELVEIRMRTHALTVRPGQFILLRVPPVAFLEWHPFTVSKCPSALDSTLTVHVRVKGDWCIKLRKYFKECEESLDKSEHLVRIEGPFYSPLETINQFKLCYFVAGGVGFTPIAAFLHHFRDGEMEWNFCRLYVTWICPSVHHVRSFAALLDSVAARLWTMNKPDAFEFDIHITRITPSDEEWLLDLEKYSFVKSRVTISKPLWRTKLREMALRHPKSHIGLFCCGPDALSRNVKKCMKMSFKGNSTTFHFKQECF